MFSSEFEKQNANPTVYSSTVRGHSDALDELDDLETDAPVMNGGFGQSSSSNGLSSARGHPAGPGGGGPEPIDALEVFELIRHLRDPEHPLTLEQLKVTSLEQCVVDDQTSTVEVLFTPTIPHCSMATLIGLCLRVKLLRSLPPRFKVVVKVAPGSHASEEAVNKQLADKERVAAALENGSLLEVVNRCIAGTDRLDQ